MQELKKYIVRLYEDVIFRCVFGREGMEIYLIGLLNAIFAQFNFPLITELTIKNPYQLPENKDQKTTILDVFAEDESGRKIDVEMQTRNQEYFDKRVIYYAARNYVDQSRKGRDYGELYPSFVVVLTRFPIPGRPADCWIDFQQLQSRFYSDVCSDDITIIYVRIPDKPGMEIPEKVCQQLQDWMRYIGSDVTSRSDIEQILSRNATIKSLDGVVERFTATEEGQMILSREDMYLMDQAGQKRFIEKQALEKGMQEGMKEGMKEGETKGVVKSIKGVLQVRFPEDFTDAFQPWQIKLDEKSLYDLNSLLPLSATCSSLSEFTQKL